MTLTEYSYLDFPESKIPGEVKAAGWWSPIPLEKVYQLNPMLKKAWMKNIARRC